MEPTSETQESLRELERDGDNALTEELRGLSGAARAVVPELVGLSLALVEDSFTFTLIAEAELSQIDAMQYLDDGPCVEAARDGQSIAFVLDDGLDEDRWSLFARASAAAGVRSTLSIPVMQDDDVVASINLYASTPRAFEGHHEELAAALGGWSPGVVADADLGFRTRLEAAATPVRIREHNTVARAVRALATYRRTSTATALVVLQTAANRAGITVVQAARTLIESMTGDAEHT